MLLVAVRALLVSGGGRALLHRMTRLALRDERAAMRLVALRALGVALRCARDDRGVTRLAPPLDPSRVMREAEMTALARLMGGIRRDEGQLLRVAVLARRMVGKMDLECVRGVARLARGAGMKIVVRRGHLVARAAGSRDRRGHRARRVRVVAADARAPRPRVVGVNVLVTARADTVARSPDVVGRVAALAVRVRRHLAAPEDVHALVT
jgi:hypothetical protein